MAKKRKRKKKVDSTAALGSLVIIVLAVVSVLLLLLKDGVILETKIAGLTHSRGYTGFDVIFGLKNGDTTVIESSTWNMVAVGLIALGAVSTLLTPLRKLRFLLSAASFVGAGVLTFLIPKNANLINISSTWLNVEPKLGTPLIFVLIFQAAATGIGLYLINSKGR